MKKHSRLRRIVWRIPYRILHALFGTVSYVSSRQWMRLAIPLFKTFGMNLTGTPRFISRTAHFDTLSNITLGDKVMISNNVFFLTHDYSPTTALIAVGQTLVSDVATERPIIVGDNVLIGLNVIVLPGTIIGNDVIIGAGSVVRGKIPAGSVVVGNPARRVCSITDYANKWLVKLDSHQVRHD